MVAIIELTQKQKEEDLNKVKKEMSKMKQMMNHKLESIAARSTPPTQSHYREKRRSKAGKQPTQRVETEYEDEEEEEEDEEEEEESEDEIPLKKRKQ